MTEQRLCPLCQGKCRVLKLGFDIILEDVSDLTDCPACISGVIEVVKDLTEAEKINLDNSIINRFPDYCAV